MSKRRFLVYVAGPISKGCIVSNVMAAHDAGIALMKAGLGVIVPHGSCFWGNRLIGRPEFDFSSRLVSGFVPQSDSAGIGHADWVEMDLEIVRRCDGVLRLPGESAGADAEVAYANECGIPVFSSVEDAVRHASTF